MILGLLKCFLKRCDSRANKDSKNSMIYFKAHDSAGIDLDFSSSNENHLISADFYSVSLWDLRNTS